MRGEDCGDDGCTLQLRYYVFSIFDGNGNSVAGVSQSNPYLPQHQ
jgi:hypothetical protein